MSKPDAPAALRNSEPILEVIRNELRDCKSVLEIGSGTGQHAVFFGREMPWIEWQTSDLESNHAGIRAWIDDAQLENVMPPIALDVRDAPKLEAEFDGAFSANTAHIMSIETVERMFEVVARCMTREGVFCLYGPFNLEGNFTSDSNRQFDQNLKAQDSEMGIRDLETLDEFAHSNSLQRTNLYAMPANNMIAVWKKR